MSKKARTAKRAAPGVALVLGCPGPGVEEDTQCGLPVWARGHCQQHYNQLRQGEELRPLGLRPWHAGRKDSRVVDVAGTVPLPGGGEAVVVAVKGCKGPSNEEGEETCGRPVYARELCMGHYRQDNAGKPLTPLRRKRKHMGGVERWGLNWRSEASAEGVRAYVADKGLEQGRELGVREFIVQEMERRAAERGFLPKKLPAGEPREVRWGCTWSSKRHADAVGAMVRAEDSERGGQLSERGYFAEELENLAAEAGYYTPEGASPPGARAPTAASKRARALRARKARG